MANEHVELALVSYEKSRKEAFVKAKAEALETLHMWEERIFKYEMDQDLGIQE